MSAENLFKIQQEARENSEELQNYLKDLENWEKEMKRKEEEIKLLKINETDTIPPIRNTFAKPKRKGRHKKNKGKEGKVKETERISSYNYKAWEKFDVESDIPNISALINETQNDSELKKLDEEKKEISSSGDSDAEEQMNLQQRKQIAILKKDKGNDFFKNGNYDSAINCYTAGIELDPENPLLPANRAMAFIKKEQYQAAENDCSACLSLDPTYIKAYLRRATARKALEKFSLAEEDYLKILELEPDNKSAQTELEKMKNELEKFEEGNFSSFSNNSSMDKEKSQDGRTPSSKLEEMLTTLDQPREFIIPSNSADSTDKQSNFPQSHSKEKSKVETSTNQLVDLSEIENVVKQLEQTLPTVPTAAYQFLTDWRKLSKYPDLRYQYLKQFPPEKLPIVFKHDMEAEIFCSVLQTLSTAFLDHGDDVFLFMKYLTQVGRFQTLIMFLSTQEKKKLKKLLDSLKCTEVMSSEIKELYKLYKV